MVRSVPKVSVLMAVFNNAPYLPQAIESVLGQSMGDFELVIGDNASTDGASEIIRHYARSDRRIVAFRNPANLGGYGNYNRCFAAAHPDSQYLADLPSDDFWDEEFLATMVATADLHPEVAIVHADYYRVDEAGVVVPGAAGRLSGIVTELPPAGLHRAIAEFYLCNYMSTQSSLINRSWLRKLHDGPTLYDESFHLLADYWLLIEMMTNGAWAYYDPVPRTYFRRHEDSMTMGLKDAEVGLLEGVRIFERELQGICPPELEPFRLRALADRYARLGFKRLESGSGPEARAALKRAADLQPWRLDVRVAWAIAALPVSAAAQKGLWHTARILRGAAQPAHGAGAPAGVH